MQTGQPRWYIAKAGGSESEGFIVSGARDEFERFLDIEFSSWKQRWADAPDCWTANCDWQRTMSAGRWSAPAWPEAIGGRGLGPLDIYTVEEVQAERGTPRLPGMLGLKNVGPTLQTWGTEDQKRHLANILSSDEIWCQGFSEPGAGSDLASMKTRAVIDGENFVINGQKIWTSDGMHATHMELLARTDPAAAKHAGISAILVDMKTEGIEVRPIRQITGEAEFAEVFFTDVRIPIKNLLGPLNEGWRVTMTTLGHERAGLAVYAARLERKAQEALDQGAKSGKLSALEMDSLLQVFVECRAVSAIGRTILDNIAAGREPGPEQSIIKLVWSEASQRLDSTLADLAGNDFALGKQPDLVASYLGGRSATIAGGTSQIVRNLLAERVLGLPR
jgi:alkylation response protein AidB-like acyl-CoA dehydrogenase